MTPLSRLRMVGQRGDVYLVGLLAAFPVARAIEFLWPASRLFGESAAYAAALLVFGISVVVWCFCHSQLRWDRLTHSFFLVVLTVWSAIVVSSLRRLEVLDLSIIAVPLIVVLLWTKRPSPATVRLAVDVLAWCITVLMLSVLLLQVVGVLDKAVAGSANDFDRENYWLPLSGLFGIDGRWIGPMRWSTVTAETSVLLVVYGASRGWLERIAFVGTGVLALLLTGARTSMFASAVGVAVLALFTGRDRIARVPKRLVFGAVALAGAVYLALWLVRNPTLTGRTEIWPVYWDLWRSSPVVGVGDAGVGIAQAAGQLPAWATTAHSIYLDPLARYGAFVFLLIVAALAVATWLSWRAARRGEAVGLAIVVALLVGGFTEALFDWRYLLVFQLELLFVAVLLASRTIGAHQVATSATPRVNTGAVQE